MATRSIRKRYWLTPPEVYAALHAEFDFDFDPCPFPRPENFDALKIDWGKRNYVNPPFLRSDALNGLAITPFTRKAIEERDKGRLVVLHLPCTVSWQLLIEAGAELRAMGRMPWLEVESKNPIPNPSPSFLAILRPNGQGK